MSSHNIVMTSRYTADPELSKHNYLGLHPELTRRIIHLAWPVLIGMFSQAFINTMELVMIGHLPGHIAVPGAAALLSSMVLLWAFGGFLSAIGVGTQALAARRFSEGNLEKSGQVLTNSLVLAILSSLALMFLAEQILVPFFHLLSPSKESAEIGISFCRIRLLGLFSMAILASYKSFYDGIGHVRVYMTIAMLMNFVNIVLSYCLIFGAQIGPFSIPSLQVEGAAIGAVSSSYIGLIVMFCWSMRKRDRHLFRVYRFKNINFPIARTVGQLSLWSGIATIILMTGFGLFQYIVGMVDKLSHTKDINSSATSIIIHIMMLVFTSCLAFGTSTATLVSQSIGARKLMLAERYCWQSVLLAMYIMLAVGLLIVAFPVPILTLFMPPDLADNNLKEAVIAAATPSLRLAGLALSPLAAAGLVLIQALNGAGKTRYVMVVEFILHFGCLVPLAWLLAVYFRLGLLGCWLAAVVYAMLLFASMATKFWLGSWKKLVI